MSLIIAKPTKPTNAQEAKDSNEFKVGDKVRYSYSVRGADVDDIFKVVKVIDYQRVIIKRIRDGKEWDEFDYNLIAARDSAQDDITPKFKIGETVKGSRGGVYPTENDIGKVVEFHPDSKTYSVMSKKYGRKIDYHENELRKANDTAAMD